MHGAVRITYPTSRLDERVRHYWLVLAGIAAIALAVATLVGLRFARWIRRPLDGLEEAAARAGAGDLTARAAVPDGPPELRTLTLEFNDMIARIDGLVAAQRDFVSDASHELRTPLTALRLRLENLERHVTAEGRQGVEAAAAEVDRLRASSTRCSRSRVRTRARLPRRSSTCRGWPGCGSTPGSRRF